MQIDVQEIKNRVSVIDYAASLTALSRESSNEWSGPCPKCGGENRFHCTDDWFFCRKCHEKSGDIIELAQWHGGISFLEAVEKIGGIDISALQRQEREERPQNRRNVEPQSPEWRKMAEKEMRKAQDDLHTASIAGVNDYLEQRGLSLATAKAFGLGAKMAGLPRTWNSEKKERVYPEKQALLIPWLDSEGQVVAIRYRFTEKHDYMSIDGRERTGENKSSKYGSDFTSRLFGLQALSRDKADRTLVVAEGEINAMSIWQLCHDMGIDVLSIGSEGQKPAEVAVVAAQYRHTILWADERTIATRLIETIPEAYGVASPNDKDANDLLLFGHLCGYIAAWRYQMCKSDDDTISLHRWLASARDEGIADAGTLQVLSAIEKTLPQLSSAPSPATIITIDSNHPLCAPEHETDYRRWLWQGMQQGNESVWSALIDIANLIWTNQLFKIDYKHEEVIRRAVEKCVIADMKTTNQ